MNSNLLSMKGNYVNLLFLTVRVLFMNVVFACGQMVLEVIVFFFINKYFIIS